MFRFAKLVLSIMALALVVVSTLGTAGVTLAQTPGASGSIAYTPADTRNAIRLINPDGTSDRLLWSTGRADQEGADDIWSISWRPDGASLVFASTHERTCSLNNADVFTLNSNGADLRRLTEAPSCASLAAYPQGQVRVPVKNSVLDSFTGFVYIQGASSAQMVNLPPGGSTVLTFTSVADFGPEPQAGVFIQGARREVSVGMAVDVVAGGTVTTGQLDVWNMSDYSIWETHSPTWRYDGTQVAYVLNLDNTRKMPVSPAPLDFGAELLTAPQSSMPDFVSRLAYGPTAATANQILYVGSDAFDSVNIFRVTEGSGTPGTPLVTLDFTNPVLGLAWLPDGSGFVYSAQETDENTYERQSNLYLYTFASGKSTRITSFSGEFTGQLSVSPESQQIVFERGPELDLFYEVVDPDLWIVNRNGSGLRLLKQNGRAPAWNPNTAPSQVDYDNRVYVPFLRR